VVADFALNSHHVYDAGSTGTYKLTDNDCAVCHAEAIVASKGAAPTKSDYNATTNPTGLHKNGYVNLRNADDTTKWVEYDVNAIKALTAATANSGNATWKAEMSGQSTDVVGAATGTCAIASASCSKGLDRFCISCHDADGASSAQSVGETNATAKNPFYDSKISNAYDGQQRCNVGTGCAAPGEVVDIASRVHETARTAAGGADTATDRDPAGSARAADGRNDPREGVFSRHAIRGLSVSVYGTTNTNWDTASYWKNATVWKSTSVMGCADCHTSDGVNTTTGNAHGSTSEYLLKSATGTAAEGTTTATYVCAQCHLSSNYSGGSHTNNGGDFSDVTGNTGTARYTPEANYGNVYGYGCGHCHGGGMASKSGATFPTGSTGAGGFGTIHGTSQVIGRVTATGTARNAYRFTNGNSMRYYDPGDWAPTTTSRTCYTLAAGAGDTWGGCTKHSGGVGDSKITGPALRPLKY
jgi:hypothetical protein